MLKDKRKIALESLKQVYLKNRQEKTRLAKNRFLGLSVFYNKKRFSDLKMKYYSNKKYKIIKKKKLNLVVNRRKFDNYNTKKNTK